MSKLHDILAARIRASGPISIEAYMSEALMHPEHGYYTTRDPFGRAGDFITAPEISQMFGELIGLSLAQAWIDQGKPSLFTLAELGPGRGTLMADMMRATASVAGFHDAAQIHLVETSPTLRTEQASRVDATWHNDITSLPDQPLILVANEFFDALPIRQFRRDGDGWREVLIDIKDDTFVTILSNAALVPALDHRLADTSTGDIVEVCTTLSTITTSVAQRISTHGGAAIIIDYGDWGSLGDTVQAVQNHKPVNPFQNPGAADITAHVDFEAIAKAAAPAKFTRLSPQGVFLERLGITGRAKTLATNLSGDALASHIAAHHRLTHPDEMGSLFKVIGLYPDTAPPPAGLEP